MTIECEHWSDPKDAGKPIYLLTGDLDGFGNIRLLSVTEYEDANDFTGKDVEPSKKQETEFQAVLEHYYMETHVYDTARKNRI